MIERGDFYQDHRSHPMLCLQVLGNVILGVSLISGEVSETHDESTKLTTDEAIELKLDWEDAHREF